MLDDPIFSRPGKKIMLSAKILLFIEIGLSAVVGIIFICQGGNKALIGLMCLFVAPVIAYFSCLLLYGYGKLIFNSQMFYHIYFKLPLPSNSRDEQSCYIDAEKN